MAILPANADYTAKDFDSIERRLQALLRSVFPTWTDFSVTNFGNTLHEMFAFCMDVVASQQNTDAREGRIVTATQRRNLLQLVQLLNYFPQLAGAATAQVIFTATGLTADCVIPAGQVVKTDGADAIEFELLVPVILTRTQPSATGLVENSETRTQTYAGTGQAEQRIVLDETPFLGIVAVTGASSGAWTRAALDNLLLAKPGDRVFSVRVDNNDRATLRFGDGVSGGMPSDVMTVRYKTGGGAVGNVAAHAITRVDGTVLDVAGNPVNLAVDNPSGATGGVDRQSEESIRELAPASVRNPVCTISRTDFEDNARALVPGISRALMTTINEDPLIPDNSGCLYVVPAGTARPDFPTAVKLAEVRRIFVRDDRVRPLRPAIATFALQVLPPVYLDISIAAKVYLTRAAAATPTSVAAVKAAVLAAYSAFFNPVLPDGTANPAINFGYYLRQGDANTAAVTGEIPLSTLMDVVVDVDGVREVGPKEADFVISAETRDSVGTVTPVLSSQHVDVALSDIWFPRLGGVTLTNGDTGLPI